MIKKINNYVIIETKDDFNEGLQFENRNFKRYDFNFGLFDVYQATDIPTHFPAVFKCNYQHYGFTTLYWSKNYIQELINVIPREIDRLQNQIKETQNMYNLLTTKEEK